MEQKFIEMSKVIFASIDHYRESGRDDKFNIDSIAEYLQRQFLLQQTQCTTLREFVAQKHKNALKVVTNNFTSDRYGFYAKEAKNFGLLLKFIDEHMPVA